MKIDKPFIEGACDSCKNHFLLDGNEDRCSAIKTGMSYTMCAQIKSCEQYHRNYTIVGLE